MKQKIIALFLGICLLCTACAGEEKQKIPIETSEKQEENKVEGKVPEVTYEDYSKDLTEEESGILLLQVKENFPQVILEGNAEAEELINRVFEQQHTRNEIRIESDLDTAEDDFYSLEEEELAQWSGYSYSYTYETMYHSSKILSMKASQQEELGTEQPFWDVVAYTFYVPEGKLLTLSDVFLDERAARTVVEQYIQEKVTSEKYAGYLLEDYESYISDILTEDVFYLNEQGLVVICNANLLTKQEAGVIEITVPYDALKGVINEEYVDDTLLY